MPEGTLTIETFEELLKHEQTLVERINAMPKGGNLFMAHPFLLLEELGIRLSDDLVAEIIEVEPTLAALSPTPYYALKEINARPTHPVPSGGALQTHWRHKEGRGMSKMAGFDLVIELSNDAVLDLIKGNWVIGTTLANPPFEVLMPISEAGLTATAHLILQ